MNMISCNGERADGLVQSVVISGYAFNLNKTQNEYDMKLVKEVENDILT
jgi:hypothetical protein